MRAILARTTIRLSDLLTLQVGDVITTEKAVDQDMTIEVEGRSKFHGSVGKFRASKAIRITRLVANAMVGETPAVRANARR